MEVRWSLQAADDLIQIVTYIQQQDSPEAARRIAQVIYERVEGLQTFPNRGSPGRVAGTRELILSPLPYIVFYRVRPEVVEVTAIIHGARQWP
jgi:addiction module RelE/StbE family toxin